MRSKQLHSFWKYMLPAITWTLVSLYLFTADMSDEGPSFDIPHLDKVVHLGIFAVMSWLYTWAWQHQKRINLSKAEIAYRVIGFGLAWASFTELLQEFLLPYRTGDAADLLADSIGTLIGWALYPVTWKLITRKLPRRF